MPVNRAPLPDLLPRPRNLTLLAEDCRSGSEAAIASSPAPRGLLWGAMTLRQLVTRDARDLRIRGVRVLDKPRYPWRGFMIDSGRAPNSLPKLKRIIRVCSAFKLNFLVFREGDDELNAVRYGSDSKHLVRQGIRALSGSGCGERTP
jgi:hypothetical protein